MTDTFKINSTNSTAIHPPPISYAAAVLSSNVSNDAHHFPVSLPPTMTLMLTMMMMMSTTTAAMTALKALALFTQTAATRSGKKNI